jgi:hypothetical protein
MNKQNFGAEFQSREAHGQKKKKKKTPCISASPDRYIIIKNIIQFL